MFVFRDPEVKIMRSNLKGFSIKSRLYCTILLVFCLLLYPACNAHAGTEGESSEAESAEAAEAAGAAEASEAVEASEAAEAVDPDGSADYQNADGIYNILLIGVDRRDDSWYGNSDTMVLVTFNDNKKQICLTSFLRDLVADIPEVGVRKLNAACAYGGPKLLTATMRENYAVDIDNYAMVDFDSAEDVIDALGGVDVELSAEEADYAGVSGSGLVHLDGKHAVTYARDRTTGGTFDFGRTQRQRNVIMAIIQKAQKGGFSSLDGAAKAALPYITHNLTQGRLLSFISKLPTYVKYNTVEQHIPFDGQWHSENEILIPTDMTETLVKMHVTMGTLPEGAVDLEGKQPDAETESEQG